MTLPVKLGGTGGTTQATARAGLSLKDSSTRTIDELSKEGAIADFIRTKANNGPNSDITSIGGLTTPLSQSQGGTGASAVTGANVTVSGTTQNLGTVLNNLSNSQQAGLVVRQTWAEVDALPSVANTSYQVPVSDVGTHPGVAGEFGYVAATGQVPNSGTFSAYGNPLLKRRVSEASGGTTVSPLSRAPVLQLAFRDPDTRVLTVLSAADSASYIQELSMPTLYPKEPSEVVVTDTPTLILASDDYRRDDISIQIIGGAGDIALNFVGHSPAFGSSNAWEQKGSEWVNHPKPGREAVTAVARGPNGTPYAGPVKLNVRVQRTINADLPSKIADEVFTRWTGDVDQRYKNVIRQEIDYLVANGIYNKLMGWWMPGSSKENFRVNLANPKTPLLELTEGDTGLIFDPYKSIKGDGISTSIDTKLNYAAMGFDASGHFLAARAIGGESAKAAVGNGQIAIRAGSTGGVYSFQSGTSPDTNSPASPAGDNKWAALSRNGDPTGYNTYVDGISTGFKSRTFTAGTDRTLKLLASGGGGGAIQQTSLPVCGVAGGYALADTSIKRFIDSCKRIEAVCSQITGT